jgi:hypothetical protein
MERQLWNAIVCVLADVDKPRTPTSFTYSDETIVKVWYWAVIHDRPMSWACATRNWPLDLRRQPRPSYSRLTRRLRTSSVQALLAALEQRVIAPKAPRLFWMIDGKPLPISGCSKDAQAGYGRAAGGKAKGYKIHAVIGSDGSIAAWRLAPMNKDERVMAERMLQTAPIQGYVVADGNYDSNKLHAVCDRRGILQLVTRRRYGSSHGTGHRKQTPGRLRSIELLENPYPAFAEKLLADRSEIERRFGHLSNWGGGLNGLPAWVRTYRRVHRWVQAKLILTALKRYLASTTYVA